MPDYFVPLDTTQAVEFYNKLFNAHVLREFTLNYVMDHNEELMEQSLDAFVAAFKWDTNKIKKLKLLSKRLKLPFEEKGYEQSEELIATYCKAEIVRLVWGQNGYYQLLNQVSNPALESSLKLFDKAARLSGSI